jgi:hypothetical protein
MTFARGARVTRPAGAPEPEPHGSELTALLVPSLHDDCDLFGVVRITGREYRVQAWRQRSAVGPEWLKLRLSPKVAR